jgi:hypothetical protein
VSERIYPEGYKQNSIFRGGPDFTLNACVGLNGGPYTTYDYASGYFMAARGLADQLRHNRSGINLLIYPVAYLYRHGIELGIKSLGEFLPSLWNESSDVRLTHELLDNWEIIKPYLMRNSDFDEDGTLISTVETILNDLVEIDPKGEAFRFARGRHGERHLQKTSLINLDVLTQAMEYVRDALYHWHRVGRDISVKASKPSVSMPPALNAVLKEGVVHTVIQLTEELYGQERSRESALTYLPSEIAGIAAEYEPQRKRLVDYLNSISYQERAELLALIWLGRGDAGEQVEDWTSLVTAALESGDDVNYIVEKEPLANYLHSGLAKLQNAGLKLA